jgi:hypothetical protein
MKTFLRLAMTALVFAVAPILVGCGGAEEVKDPKLPDNAPKLQPKTAGGPAGKPVGPAGASQ